MDHVHILYERVQSSDLLLLLLELPHLLVQVLYPTVQLARLAHASGVTLPLTAQVSRRQRR